MRKKYGRLLAHAAIFSHQERKFMMEKQKHLTNWVPIVCPFTEWRE